MLFDYAQAQAGQTVLVHGAAGNVGAYAVQLAHQAGLRVYATTAEKDTEYVRQLGASQIIDFERQRFEQVIPPVDIVLDLVGGETRERSYPLIKPGGILVSAVSQPAGHPEGIRAVFFLVEVTTPRLERISSFFDGGKLVPQVGSVLPLQQVRTAHEMLAGASHKRGKIVLALS
jgi:NADPH:quinone reductase-like Zn-dependent oxidoreductase